MSDAKKKIDEDLARLQSALDLVSEHFDAVHIFATRHEPGEGGTIACNKGVGNWHARYGQIREYVTKEEEAQRMEVREHPGEDES